MRTANGKIDWLGLIVVVCVLAVVALLLFGAVGCKSTPVIPKVNTVVVEKFKPLPDWADKPVAKPVLPDTTVGGHATQENALDAWFDYFVCIRGLVRQLDAGKTVTPDDCKVPKP